MKSRDARADNLLLRLFAYSPRVGRQALEDYCTEALAWCLRKSPSFLTRFLNLTGIAALNDRSEQAEVHTQMSFDSTDPGENEEANGGRFDLVIEGGVSAPFVLVVETKVGSGFGPEQLKLYRNRLNAADAFEDVPRRSRYLITLTTVPYPSKLADSSITWPNVHNALTTGSKPSDALVAGLIDQFTSFLTEKGLAMLKLNKTDGQLLGHWIEVKALEEQLRQIVERLRNQEEVKPVVGRRQVKSDGEWIGVTGKNGFWAGCGISITTAGPELYLWVEITISGDGRKWIAGFDSETKAAFNEAKRYLKHHEDLATANFNKTSYGNSRFVFVKRVAGSLSGDGEAVFGWLYRVSQTVIDRAQRATPRA